MEDGAAAARCWFCLAEEATAGESMRSLSLAQPQAEGWTQAKGSGRVNGKLERIPLISGPV